MKQIALHSIPDCETNESKINRVLTLYRVGKTGGDSLATSSLRSLVANTEDKVVTTRTHWRNRRIILEMLYLSALRVARWLHSIAGSQNAMFIQTLTNPSVSSFEGKVQRLDTLALHPARSSQSCNSLRIGSPVTNTCLMSYASMSPALSPGRGYSPVRNTLIATSGV